MSYIYIYIYMYIRIYLSCFFLLTCVFYSPSPSLFSSPSIHFFFPISFTLFLFLSVLSFFFLLFISLSLPICFLPSLLTHSLSPFLTPPFTLFYLYLLFPIFFFSPFSFYILIYNPFYSSLT